jgi:membrane associated rhomboid family serine protease
MDRNLQRLAPPASAPMIEASMTGQYVGFAWPRMTPAVKALLIANGVVLLVNMLLTGRLAPLLGLSWANLGEGYGLGVVRLITYQFVHSFADPFHILFNMLMLYFFGTFVEEAIGKTRLLRLYLTAGVVGGVVQLLMAAATGDTRSLTIGASGCLYGILVYAACLAPRMRVIFIIFPLELRWLVGGLVVLGVWFSYIELATGASSGVAHGGHLGGALWGWIAYRLPRRQWGWVRRLREWQQERDRRSARERELRVDELLDKVHRHGLSSLTSAERRFLDRASHQMRRR